MYVVYPGGGGAVNDRRGARSPVRVVRSGNGTITLDARIVPRPAAGGEA